MPLSERLKSKPEIKDWISFGSIISMGVDEGKVSFYSVSHIAFLRNMAIEYAAKDHLITIELTSSANQDRVYRAESGWPIGVSYSFS